MVSITRDATPIDISSHPSRFHGLYTEEQRSLYSNKLVWTDTNKDMREQLEPHVYEVSSLSYKGLAFGGKDQSILVSGESGAG
jgi:myosin heavy subunit